MRINITKKLSYCAGAFTLCFVANLNATLLSLSATPLAVSGAVDPNIMLMFDTSGSMNQIVPESPYNSGTTYGSCTGGNRLSSGTYYLKVEADGSAKISNSSGGTTYNWGNSGSNKCFSSSRSYNAFLQALGGSTRYLPADITAHITGSPNSGLVPGGAGSTSYDANYLNWYFSDATQSGPDNFGVGGYRKIGTRDRMDIAKAAADDLFSTSGLNNVKAGLTGFTFGTSSSSGMCGGCDSFGKILYPLVDIDNTTNRANLRAAAAALGVDGNTPLAGTLSQIGRYFVEGHNESLTLSSANVTSPKNAYTFLSDEPDYAVSSYKPTAGNGVIEYSCQQNFVIALTDGAPSTDSDYSDDLAKWDDNTVNHSNTSPGDLDDVAAALFDTDLRPDFTDDTNNITTYTIGFSEGVSSSSTTLLTNTAAAGGGSYYDADDASGLSTALNSIASEVQEQVGTSSAVAFNSSQLDTDTAIYFAQFNSGDWSGNLHALPLSDTGTVESVVWNAATELDTQITNGTHTVRNIFTYDGSEGITFTTANFASFTTAMKNDLYRSVDIDGDGNSADGNATNDDNDAQSLINFIRGDATNEGSGATQYRDRLTLLGDIVNSSPVYVGAPQLSWPDYIDDAKFGDSATGESYSDYVASSAATRTEMLYFGANDGMLHGVKASVSDSDGGEEDFAYIPNFIASNNNDAGLHYLAEQDYAHNFYVDSSPSISDIYIDRDTVDGSSEDWITVLIGGARAGGKGLFALDVSDPSEFSTATNADEIVLWEFTDTDFGYSYAQPTIAMMPNGKWAAIVGNGYNSTNEKAFLYIIYIEKGIDGSWTAHTNDGNTANDDFIKIATNTTTSNGLSTPRVVDLDGDGVADRVYAGDLQGNMWVFDVSSTDHDNWAVAYDDGGSPATSTPLFSAKDASNNAQPITSQPVLSTHPSVATETNSGSSDYNEPNVMVFFGTGQFIEPNDLNTTDSMSYYAVWDANAHSKTRSSLAARTLSTSSGLRTIAGSAIDWATQFGWYMDLPTTGERMVSSSAIRREVLFFNTIIPDDTECEDGGTGWLMSVDFATGLAPDFGIFDANDDGTIDDIASTGDKGFIGVINEGGLPSDSAELGDQRYWADSSCNDSDKSNCIKQAEIDVGEGEGEGRLSWEELISE